MSGRKEWMLGIPGHNELVTLDAVLLLVRGGQLRPTDLVKKLGEPWRAANEVTDLAPHFSDVPGQSVPKAVETIPLRPSETARPSEPIRSTTDKVPRTMGGGKTPDSSKSIPKMEAKPSTRPPEDRPAEDRSPIRSITSRVPPASGAPSPKEAVRDTPKPSASAPPPIPMTSAVKEDVKSETRRTPLQAPATDKIDKISSRKAGVRRDLPKPPPKPEPRIEPMAGKYYSPVDMLRGASFAFEPKKLWYSAPVAFLVALWSVGLYAGSLRGGTGELALTALFTALLLFGLSFMLTGLALVSRRQLEGRDYYFGEMIHYAVKSIKTAIVYPAISLVPSLICVGFLFLMKVARNKSPGMASALKIGYILPMMFAIVAVLGALVYQVASMYVPAAGAAEGEGTWESLRHAWTYVRRQWGRVVLHWLIVTVAVGVISAVFVGLAVFAILLPEWIFGNPDDAAILNAWSQFEGIQSLYRGVACGLGMILPISLFSTLGMLSY
ncbi:MAG TPA: hypothetical protein VKW04_21195, partial [Planctomycetota bacterium]|nr:hypothetical protein [Planctomycetota bacterium]